MGAIYYKGEKYGAMPSSAANLPYEAGSQDSTKDKIDDNAAAITALQTGKQDALSVSAVTTLSSDPLVQMRTYGKIVQISVNTLTNSYGSGETNIATIPSGYRPLYMTRLYKGNGTVAIETSDGRIWAENIPSYSVFTFVYLS